MEVRAMAGISKRMAATVMGMSLVALPLAAAAQDVPSYASPDAETIHGKVDTITGRFTLTIDDERGFTDSVTMHDGTVIEPQGVSLEVGQDVTIIGHTDGKTFDASEVDTDGADDSTTYNDASAPGDYYSGGYPQGAYPAYVVPIGGDYYYYGNSSGGYYYNAGGGNYHPHGNGSGGGSSSPGTPHVPRPRVNPVVYPIVRGSGISPRTGYSAPSSPRTYSAPSAPRSFSGSVHASAPSHR